MWFAKELVGYENSSIRQKVCGFIARVQTKKEKEEGVYREEEGIQKGCKQGK